MSGSDLQNRLDDLGPGDTLKLEPAGREFQGPLVIRRPVVIDGRGGTVWAPRGPVLSVESPGVELNNFNVEVTSKEAGLSPEEACALRVAPGLAVRLNHVSVRGTVRGLDSDEGTWSYPRSLDLKTIKAGQLQEFKARLVVPVPCSLESGINGLTLDPCQAQGGPVEITLRVSALPPGTLLRGEIRLKTALLTRKILVSGNVVKVDDGRAPAPADQVVCEPPGGWPAVATPAADPQLQPTTSPAGLAVEPGPGSTPLTSKPVVTVPVSIVVSPLDEGDYRTLGEALRAARTGTRILVRPGFYRESLTLDKRVEIIGDGARSDIVLESQHAPCLTMEGDFARVRGLTLRGPSGAAPPDVAGQPAGGRPARGASPALSVARGQLIVEDCDISAGTAAGVAVHGAGTAPILRRCRIQGSRAAGVLFYDHAEGVLEDCEIADSALAGLEIRQGANPVVRRCRITDSRQAGALVHDHGRGALDGCELSGNGLAGVEIARGGNPVLFRCKIQDGKYPGLLVRDGGRGTAEDCEILGNALAGVEVRQDGNPTLRRCRVGGGRQDGLLFIAQARGTVEDCEVTSNGLAGVAVRQGSTPLLRRCKVHGNAQGGVVFAQRARGTLDGCDVHANGWAGVAVLTEAEPTLLRCKLRDGKLAGLVVAEAGGGTAEDCDISGNGLAGVVVTAGGSPVLRRCRIRENGDVGVWAYGKASGHVEDCDLTGNTRAPVDLGGCRTFQFKGNKV